MQKKLQELTEKLYQEGVDKANEEAEKIIDEAKKEANDLISKAKKDAEKIVKEAEKNAEETKNNSLNELQLASKQAISELKQTIAKLIEMKAVEPETKEAFSDKDFTKNIILTIVKNWNPNDESQVELRAVLPDKQQKDFEKYFKSKAKKTLDKGLEIEFSEDVKGGFKIGPKDGSYLISFTDKDFDNFFKTFLRPGLIELLYEGKDKEKEDKNNKNKKKTQGNKKKAKKDK